MQIAGCHTTETETGSVHVVAGDDGVDGAEVELTGMVFTTGFHEVLDQCLGAEDDDFESRYLFDAVHEKVHGTLFLGEGDLTYFSPIFVALGQHVGFLDDFSFQAEEAGFYFVKVVFRIFGRALHFQSLNTFHQGQFYGHIVVCQYPVAVGQLFELLYDVQTFNEVYTCFFRQVHGTFFYGVGRVFHHIQMACKAEVLRIVGDERQVYTFMLVYHECIHQVISVERDGSSPDGAYEAALQQADVVVVDIDV